ncbi:MAG: toll/interleukin-1 receptor domain-containing protein [Candidatus Hermodarchaeota archaeon]
MVKESSKKEPISFDMLLQSITVAEMKDLIKQYNEKILDDPEKKPLKGFSSLKKQDLVHFLSEKLNNTEKEEMRDVIEPNIAQKTLTEGMALIMGEGLFQKEKIMATSPISGGKGYKLWFKGTNWEHKSTVQISPGTTMELSIARKCNCGIGRNKGICGHQMAGYLMLYAKNRIQVDDFPVKIEGDWFTSIQEKLELHASQSLFKEEPEIVLEEDYNVYINGHFVTLEWGGNFPGKTIKDISKEEDDVETWVAKKIAHMITRKIKVRKKTGYLISILVDSYDVITKIMERPKLVAKILRKISVLENPSLPTDEKSLEAFLRKDLKESLSEIEVEPPFDAYMGDKPYIFCSYTHKDKKTVYPIIKRLNDEGIKVWYDEGIPLSTDWEEYIMKRLAGCAVVLSFVTPNILKSKMTKKEILTAMEKKKIFLGVYLQETNLDATLKIIRTLQGLQKYDMSDERFYSKLIQSLNGLMKKE